MRVFNVSHHRCGTFSMSEALKILGFDSHHWGDGMNLWKPWLEGKLGSVEALQADGAAWSDTPFQLMYKDLHELFPEAKFIFVARERQAWLRSIRRHLRGSPPMEVHTLLYGYAVRGDRIDDEALLRGYDRISADILTYFSGWPNFLALRLETIRWGPLCEFLGKPVPDVPFPRLNVSEP